MAKPKKSKLLSQGQKTGKGKPKNARGIPKVSRGATGKGQVPRSRSDLLKNVEDLDESAASALTLGSSTASQGPVASVFSSKARMRRPTTYLARRRHSVSSQQLDQHTSETTIPHQIYTLKKAAVEDQLEIHPAPYSSESEEVEEGQVAGDEDSDFEDDSILSEAESHHFIDPHSDKGIKVRFDMLKDIRYIPELDELSAKSLAAEDSRMGVFRDPLDAGSSIFSVAATSLQSEQDYDLLDVEEPIRSSSNNSEFIYKGSDFESESNDESNDWQVILPRHVEVDTKPEVTHAVDTSVAKHHRKLLISQTLQIYLSELMDQVVGQLQTAGNQLKNRLDKHKMIKHLSKLVEEYYNEKDKNDYLVNRVTVHHQRHFKYSLITPEPSPSVNERNQQRCQNALNDLDCQLKKMQEAEKIYLTERDRLQAELARKRSQDEREVERLEGLIQKTLLPHTKMPKRLECIINHALDQMRKKRNQISETRLDLITKQHINSYVMQKLEEKETIAEGLKLDKYEAVMLEVNDLGESLSMKTAELHRLYALLSNNIHTISHLRCRRKLVSRSVLVVKAELLQLKKKHSDLQTKVYQSYRNHNKLLAQIREIQFKGGLLNYPLLLMDYDNTGKMVTEKRERISLLKAHHERLLEKLEQNSGL